MSITAIYLTRSLTLGPSGELGTPHSVLELRKTSTFNASLAYREKRTNMSSDLRQRQVPSSKEPNREQPAKQQKKGGINGTNTGISILDIIRVLVTLVVASCGLSYYTTSSESLLWGYRPWFTRWPLVVQYIVSTPSPTNIYIHMHSNYNSNNYCCV